MPRGRPRKTPEEVLMKSAELIGWAIGGLEREIAQTRERLAVLTAQAVALRARVTGPKTPSTAEAGDEAGPKPKRRMSVEARKRISEMMTKRWAERRKTNK